MRWKELAVLIRQCTLGKRLADGRSLHSRIVEAGYGGDTYLCNLLMLMYGSCGSVAEARAVFSGIVDKQNAFSCNIMMGVLIRNERLQEARLLFESSAGRDVVSWNALVAAYARLGHLHEARSLFERMAQHNVVSWNAMLNGYSKNELVYHAKQVFDSMLGRDIVSWHSMIAAFAKAGHSRHARTGFERMASWNVVSWNAIVSACIDDGKLAEASELVGRMPEQDVVTWNSMVTAFSQAGDMQRARKVFESMVDKKDVISWNAMVTGYVRNGDLVQARKLFEETPVKNVTSWAAMVAAYVQQGDLVAAKSVYDRMKQPSMVASTCMFTAYAQCGKLNEARMVFDTMQQKDVISWSAMMTAYAHNGRPNEALDLFRLRDLEGVDIDRSSLIVAIDACAVLSCWSTGRIIHACAVECRLDMDVAVGNSLLSMYGRCASLDTTRKVFDKMRDKNLISWNTMMTAYSQNGYADETLELGFDMLLMGMNPDVVTFMNLLSACSHKGLLRDAWWYFISMGVDHGVAATVDHYHCMIDLVARSGCLQDAEELIEAMPFEPQEIAWRTLLSAASTYADSSRGCRAAESLMSLGMATPGEYVMLANLKKSEGTQKR